MPNMRAMNQSSKKMYERRNIFADLLTRPFHLGFYPFLWLGVDIDDSCDDSDQFAFTVGT
jgi:hypothetical protein